MTITEVSVGAMAPTALDEAAHAIEERVRGLVRDRDRAVAALAAARVEQQVAVEAAQGGELAARNATIAVCEERDRARRERDRYARVCDDLQGHVDDANAQRRVLWERVEQLSAENARLRSRVAAFEQAAAQGRRGRRGRHQ